MFSSRVDRDLEVPPRHARDRIGARRCRLNFKLLTRLRSANGSLLAASNTPGRDSKDHDIK